jgi:hypothetical protein
MPVDWPYRSSPQQKRSPSVEMPQECFHPDERVTCEDLGWDGSFRCFSGTAFVISIDNRISPLLLVALDHYTALRNIVPSIEVSDWSV